MMVVGVDDRSVVSCEERRRVGIADPNQRDVKIPTTKSVVFDDRNDLDDRLCGTELVRSNEFLLRRLHPRMFVREMRRSWKSRRLALFAGARISRRGACVDRADKVLAQHVGVSFETKLFL